MHLVRTVRLALSRCFLSTKENENKLDFKLLFKGLLLAIILALFMYVQCFIAEKLFMLDFRFIWPFFKGFSLLRFGQFLIYMIIFLVFFLLNNSKNFAQNQPTGTCNKGFKGFIKCWYKNALCMIGGVLLLIHLKHYFLCCFVYLFHNGIAIFCM